MGAADEWNLDYHLAYERSCDATVAAGVRPREGGALLWRTRARLSRGARLLARRAVVSRGAAVRRSAGARTGDARRGDGARSSRRASPRERWASSTSQNGVPATDAAEQAALASVFGLALPRLVAVKDALGENPAIGAVQLALAADALRRAPAVGAVLVNAFGAGGNFLAAVLTAA